ncbi:MAG TPA: recombinase RecA [Candidatus Fermentibacter daniensis]|jgi:recombination protein RecA|nr:MAG: recombinase RecA [Candidatus Fermentibacter daniensis]MBP7719104.1 recombinase RecA [Candidatus Fermentibacter sp.]OQC69394.1 MAG: recombinase A [candidate division Hyd24-12 bacterium ADurb.Bin004]KZD17944.1 MAG: recombinase RecA [Candidatus Fermentibacter daniensis]KZD19690.1 MAG: recombinase RecA [Candidatus Fermentibacter daniensis]
MAKENPRDEKQKALQAAFMQIQKQFGQGSIMRLGENEIVQVDTIPTGSLSLDAALGIGGIPKGRITEIYGAESSGKTTLAMHILANAQRMGGEAAFIDAEHALDPIYAGKIGLDVDRLLVSQPSSGEQALEITEMLVRSNAVDAVCVDSVAALVPKAELEGDMGDAHVGLQARLMSQALRKLTGAVSRSNCAVIFINQIRMQIGIMFGNPETTTGGRALKFYSSVRIDIRRIASLKEGEEIHGSRTKAKVVKNKLAPPFKQCEFDIIHGKGISLEGELVDLGLEKNILQRRGTWYSYGDLQIGQGRENSRRFLEENREISDKLQTELRRLYDLPVAGEDRKPQPRAAKTEN